MKLYQFKSIKTRLAFWFLLLTMGPLILVLGINYFQLANNVQNRMTEKLVAIRDLKEKSLRDWFMERRGDLITVSADHELRDLEFLISKSKIENNDISVLNDTRSQLTRYLDNYSSYSELFILNPENGNVVVSTSPHLEGQDKSNEIYYLAPLKSKELFITNIFHSNTLGEQAMCFSIPIFCTQHIEKHIVGILVARIDLKNSLFKLLSDRVGLGKTGETLIVSNEGLALNDLRWHENASLNLRIKAEPAIRAAKGETGIVKTEDYRGEKVLAAFTNIQEGNINWGFVCKQDMAELDEPIRKMVMNILLIFLVSSLIIVLVSIRISSSISKPLIELGKATMKMGKGNFNERVINDSPDELGMLSKDFNNLAHIIETRNLVQEGISNISSTIIGKNNLESFAQSLVKLLLNLTDANMGAFYILNDETKIFEPFASIGANERLLRPFTVENLMGEIGNVLAKKEIHYLTDLPADTKLVYNSIAGDITPREIITIPVLVENSVVAVISLISIKRFNSYSIEMLKLAWNFINTFYSNLLSNERTRILAEQMVRINNQLEAQAEELRDQAEELKRTSYELQEQNVELEKQREQVEEATKLKSEFLSNMSHELRTPLNSILSLAGVLVTELKSKVDQDEFSYLQIIERNGKQLLHLINELLDLSKIESGKMEIMPHKFSIKQLLRDVKENLYSLASEKGIQLHLLVPPVFPDMISDEKRIHQILINIIGNAIKFTPKGEVKIHAEYESGWITIKVIDTGIGISKEMLPTIFEEFRQADGTSSRKYEGTGLGLAIAQKLTHVLGGKISVESEVGVGTEFTICFPLELEVENFDSSFHFQLEKDAEQDLTGNAGGERILIVEDNQEAIVQIKWILEKRGFTIDVVQSGVHAVEYVKNTIPDGIILDLMMPGLDGFEVLEKIRNTKKTRNIPVLILTAKDLTQKDLERLSSNNIQQLVQKGNVNLQELVNKVMLMVKSKIKPNV